jgi:hypothetical protein
VDKIELQGKLIVEELLLAAYLAGKRSGTLQDIYHIGRFFNPYDRRTRKGRLWKLGFEHALEEVKGVFYIPPIEIFGGSLHKVDYRKLLKKD